MKIRSICQHTAHQCVGGVLRLLAVCAVAALGVMTCAPAPAQVSQAAGHITHGNEAFRIVSASSIPTVADAGTDSQAPEIALVGCQSCGTSCGGSCGATYSGCQSCGTSCGGSCGGSYCRRRGDVCTPRGFGYSPFSGYGHPCAPCAPYWYGTAEVLYMKRDTNERFSLTNDYTLGDYDYEPGARVTIGRVPDCVHGYELSYTGRLEWDRAFGLTSAAGALDSQLEAGVPLLPTDVSAFDSPVFLSAQAYTTEYWSVEGSRTMTGWDVARLLVGVRYLEYDERYAFVSQNATESGFFGSATDNQLFGIQTGLDLLYPISRNGYTDFRSRIGGFINFAESEVRLINAGTVHINNFDDTERFAGVFELGGGVRYYFGQLLSIRAGAEVWYLTGIAKANGQFGNVVSPRVTGVNTRAKSDLLISGLSVGAELRF